MSVGRLCRDMTGVSGSIRGKGLIVTCSQWSPYFKAVDFQLSEISHREKAPLSSLVHPTIMPKLSYAFNGEFKTSILNELLNVCFLSGVTRGK